MYCSTVHAVLRSVCAQLWRNDRPIRPVPAKAKPSQTPGFQLSQSLVKTTVINEPNSRVKGFTACTAASKPPPSAPNELAN